MFTCKGGNFFETQCIYSHATTYGQGLREVTAWSRSFWSIKNMRKAFGAALTTIIDTSILCLSCMLFTVATNRTVWVHGLGWENLHKGWIDKQHESNVLALATDADRMPVTSWSAERLHAQQTCRPSACLHCCHNFRRKSNACEFYYDRSIAWWRQRCVSNMVDVVFQARRE